jgi:uncharacterized protein YgiM (DUF1202 family)
MSNKKITVAIAAAAVLGTLAPAASPTIASAQSANGVTNCDAPGGRQRTGALIGGVLGALAGSQISDNERALGAVAGGAAGAAAGSYIGCNQQRQRAAAYSSNYNYGSGDQYRAGANLNIRSGPGTGYRSVGRLSPGQPFTATGSQGEWIQIAGGGWVNARYVTR